MNWFKFRSKLYANRFKNTWGERVAATIFVSSTQLTDEVKELLSQMCESDYIVEERNDGLFLATGICKIHYRYYFIKKLKIITKQLQAMNITFAIKPYIA